MGVFDILALKHAPVVINVSGLEAPVNWTRLQQAVSSTGLRIVAGAARGVFSLPSLRRGSPARSISAFNSGSLQPLTFLKHAPVVINVSGLEAPVNWTRLQQAVSSTGLRMQRVLHVGFFLCLH
jgi:septum formation inhibitor MinC